MHLAGGDELKVGVDAEREAGGGHRQVGEHQLPAGRAHRRQVLSDGEGEGDGRVRARGAREVDCVLGAPIGVGIGTMTSGKPSS